MYMLDTNICIHLINSKCPLLARRISDVPSEEICMSAITQAELEFGVSNSQNPAKNAQALAKFLSTINVLDFDAAAAVSYGIIRADLQRRGKPIGPLDTLIAGHASSIDAIVVTNNVREFSRVDGLVVEDWTQSI